jgi:hypothetical protein
VLIRKMRQSRHLWRGKTLASRSLFLGINPMKEKPMTALLAEETTVLEVGLPQQIELALVVRDHDMLMELWQRKDGRERDQYAMSALRLGILALRSATGAVDAGAIRHAGEHLVGQIREMLVERSAQLTGELAAALKTYFDPASGQIPQRLEQLVKSGGDLDHVLAKYIDGDGSSMARTLAEHVGKNSPLLRSSPPTRVTASSPRWRK